MRQWSCGADRQDDRSLHQSDRISRCRRHARVFAFVRAYVHSRATMWEGCATTPPVMRLMRAPLYRTVSPSTYGDRERFWDARYRDRRGTPMVNNKLRNADHITSAVSLRSSRTAFRVSPTSQLLCFTSNFPLNFWMIFF